MTTNRDIIRRNKKLSLWTLIISLLSGIVFITNNKKIFNFLGEISSLGMKKGTTFEKKAELKLKSDEGAAGGSNGAAAGTFIENATEEII